MSTNQQSTQYRTQTTQPTIESTPEPEATAEPTSASERAPRTFEPTNTGTLPPMFETEAQQRDR